MTDGLLHDVSFDAPPMASFAARVVTLCTTRCRGHKRSTCRLGVAPPRGPCLVPVHGDRTPFDVRPLRRALLIHARRWLLTAIPFLCSWGASVACAETRASRWRLRAVQFGSPLSGYDTACCTTVSVRQRLAVQHLGVSRPNYGSFGVQITATSFSRPNFVTGELAGCPRPTIWLGDFMCR